MSPLTPRQALGFTKGLCLRTNPAAALADAGRIKKHYKPAPSSLASLATKQNVPKSSKFQPILLCNHNWIAYILYNLYGEAEERLKTPSNNKQQ